MTDKVVSIKDRAPWRRSHKSALKQDLADVEGRLLSMSMLLHALIQRHGTQLFALDAVEQCDPNAVHVDVDHSAGRVTVRLTHAAEK